MPFVEKLMLTVVAINTIVLCMYYYGAAEAYVRVLDAANNVCTGLFAAEMALKLFAVGLDGYMEDPWNRLDGALVLIQV